MSKANDMLEILNNGDIQYVLDVDNHLYQLSTEHSQNNLIDVDTEEFKEFSLRKFYEVGSDTIPESAYRQAVSTLKGIKKGVITERVTLHNRVARHENAIWHYLGKGKAVRICPGSVDIMDQVPTLFRSFSHQSSLQLPILEDVKSNRENLDLIFNYANIKDPDQRLLFQTSLVFALLPDVPHPIDLIVGPPGSSKTTATLIKKSLIDPVSGLRGFSIPKSESDFHLMASQHHVVTFDNMPFIKNLQSDMFCKAVTGEEMVPLRWTG